MKLQFIEEISLYTYYTHTFDQYNVTTEQLIIIIFWSIFIEIFHTIGVFDLEDKDV